MIFKSKKGIMGIGTLIIFIATILVAAVAAAVIISTSNVLQQRSLLVGSEARKAITNGIEVVSILSESDTSTETFNNYEIMVRLSPGSDSIQMRTFNMDYISGNFDDAASLQYSANETSVELGSINLTENTTVYDMDGDGTDEVVILVKNVSGTFEGVKFYLSDLDVWSDTISIMADLEAAGTTNVTLDLDELAITYDESIYGFIQIVGDTSEDDEIIDAVNVTVSEVSDSCTFELLQPETRFCYTVLNGNDDYVLGNGERFKILYRLKSANEPTIGEDFMFIFNSEKGRLSEARARTPDVVTSSKTKLWPLG